MDKFKKGDRVRVVSDCLTKNATGTVREEYLYSVTVVLDKDTVPYYYSGSGVHDFSPKSLQLLPQRGTELTTLVSDLVSDSVGGKEQIGVFLTTGLDKRILYENGSLVTDHTLVVFAHTKEHCLKHLNECIDGGDCDNDTFEYLLFGGKVYELGVKVTVVIEED